MDYLKLLKENLLPINRRILKKATAKQTILLEQIAKKLSMQDDIWQIKDIRFYVPNYPLDGIQSGIVDSNKFFEQDLLEDVSQYMPQDPVICDIGSNIGNHTLYWLYCNNAKFIYCFEPRVETFRILEKNIKINGFDDKVQCYNFALSEKKSRLRTVEFLNENIGMNAYKEDMSGATLAVPLEDIDFKHKIDFIKIDTEGMEDVVLMGSKRLIQQDRPIILL